MNKMRNTMKCMAAMFVMAMAFMVTGITAQAGVTGLQQTYADDSSIKISWSPVAGAKYYGWQISTDANFTNILKSDYASVSYGTDNRITGLTVGTTYYIRVGSGTTNKNCYANWSTPLEVVTAPDTISDVVFADATDNTATISYSSTGANRYEIYDYNTNSLIAQTPDTTYTIQMNNAMSNEYYVKAYRVSAAGYAAAASGRAYATVNLLTTKIGKNSFGITSVLDAINVLYVTALYSGSGVEVEFTNAGGSKWSQTVTDTKSYSSYGSDLMSVSYKDNKFLKYRVRAYVDLTTGRKYGEWSDYRGFCEIDNAKYTNQNRRVNIKWSKKINGSGKIKVQVSNKEKKGYKTFKTLKASSKSVSVNKFGKKALVKNKSYYVRLVPMVKIGKKYIQSDYISNTGKVKIR